MYTSAKFKGRAFFTLVFGKAPNRNAWRLVPEIDSRDITAKCSAPLLMRDNARKHMINKTQTVLQLFIEMLSLTHRLGPTKSFQIFRFHS